MPKKPDPATGGLVRRTRAFLMESLEADSIALRPDRPGVRKPITPLAERVFRALLFTFEDVLTGLCFPSLAVIAAAAGCSDNSVKTHLKALKEAGYLTWMPGERKRVKTRKGWRWVRGSNRYRLLCPFRHLNGLRRELLRFTGGKLGHVIHNLLLRYMPPAKAEKPAANPVPDPETNPQPPPPQAEPAQEPTPSQRAPPAPEGALEVGGITITDPKLASVLSHLWAAFERQGKRHA